MKTPLRIFSKNIIFKTPLTLECHIFFFGITSTDLKKKLFFLKRWLTRGKRFLKKGEKRLINGERSMVKIGGIRTVWLVGEILKKKKTEKM